MEKKTKNKKPAAPKRLPLKQAALQGGLLLLTGVAAGGAGAAMGKMSLLASLPLMLLGAMRDNKYLMAAGLGLAVGVGAKGVNDQMASPSMQGFDFKQTSMEATERAKNYFRHFADKLFIPKATAQTSTVSGIESEPVNYFINPYSGDSNRLDLSELDKWQVQIARMAAPVEGIEDIQREF